jgi:hypothetical protein
MTQDQAIKYLACLVADLARLAKGEVPKKTPRLTPTQWCDVIKKDALNIYKEFGGEFTIDQESL